MDVSHMIRSEAGRVSAVVVSQSLIGPLEARPTAQGVASVTAVVGVH